MNRRSVKIMRRKAGGTAGKNAEKYSVNLPAVWLRAMGIQKDNRVELSFDGEKITIALADGILAVYICWQENNLA